MLLEMFPNAKVVTNAKVKENVINMLHVDESKFIVINDGDELSLGDKTLQFIIAPFVHWPDTMFTYLKEDKMLFTCDFLGAHYTKHELFADYTEGLIEAVKRYYAEIIMPFRNFAKKYTDKVKSMDVEIILPSHGPVYDKPEWILDLYADWTSERVENKVVIPYVSMYESTKMMVERLAQNLEKAGVEVKLFDLVNFDEGELSMELVDCATVVLGSSMVLAGPHPAAVMAAYLANALRPKFRYYSIVGSYGWGGNLEGTLESMFTIIKPQKLDYVVIKGQPRKEDFEKIDNLSNEIIEKHKSL
jgi:flavorubredoxin